MARKSSEIAKQGVVKRKPGRPRGGRKELAIPATSVLAPLVRKGAEGVCISCRKPIREHYGHRGVWTGCRAPEVPATATFLLVPVILPADRPMTTGVRHGRATAAEMSTVATVERGAATRAPRTTHVVGRSAPAPAPASEPPIVRVPRFVYRAADRRRNLVGASEAVTDAYKGLLRAKDPVTATQAAKLAKRPTEANRRCLNWLVAQGLAVRTEVEP